MDDLSRLKKASKGQGSFGTEKLSVCSVCKGKGYFLAATRKVNQTPIIFERKDCRLCSGTVNKAPDENIQELSRERKKKFSGTGYLRNKKRRRKDDEQNDFGK